MSQRQLANGANVSQQTVAYLEQKEAASEATVRALNTLAPLLGGRFVTVFVQEKSLDNLYMERTKAVAKQRVDYVDQQMRLEGQQVTDNNIKKEIERLTEEFVASSAPSLWD